MPSHEGHGVHVARLDIAEIDEPDPAVFVDDHVQREDPPDRPDDLDLRLVQRIAFDDAVGGPGMLQDARPVEAQDRIPVGDARGDHLAPSGVPRHEVGLDQAGHDLQVRLDETPVDPDRDAPGRLPEIDVGFRVPREVVLDPDGAEHFVRSDQLPKLLPLVGAVQPGGDQDQDPLPGNARFLDRRDQRGKQRAVGDGPGDVADEDAGAFPAPGDFRERRASHGLFQRLPHRTDRVLEGLHRMLADHRDADVVRKVDGKGAPPVKKVYPHGPGSRDYSSGGEWCTKIFSGPSPVFFIPCSVDSGTKM